MRHEEYFWAERAKRGDRRAFGLLAERYQSNVRRWLRAAVRADKVEDLSQETLLRAFTSIETLRDPSRFPAWLRGIALNVIRMHYRRSSNENKNLQGVWSQLNTVEINDGSKYPTENQAMEALHSDQLAEALANVKEPYREAITLHYLDGKSYKEIANKLGISIPAVKSRLHRARQQLKEHLSTTEVVIMREFRENVEASIHEVYRSELNGKEPHAIVILKSIEGEQFLPIWIGVCEGQAILMGLRGEKTPRPLTHKLMGSLLKAAGVKVDSVVISKLEEEVFYSDVCIRGRQGLIEVDSRPSDGLTLALEVGAPIFISPNVLDEAGVEDISPKNLCKRFELDVHIEPLELPELDDWWGKSQEE